MSKFTTATFRARVFRIWKRTSPHIPVLVSMIGLLIKLLELSLTC